MWLIFKLSQRRGGPIRSNPKDVEMASPRDVNLLDRAESPLSAPFLTRLRHFSRHFVFIYEATP
ncbi:hypothetical protein SIAM614_24122 [Stappia aggregata IAM 12614]|uniref:Uncharacterized protein n=1 Tax=Roseibium aggregatum (strain ATCC 25650 / DSM 13394 / JCM 20685 / NBRC 16684 / NCIMB 2208 / IAM 12614 / B1) TaxID=384765 RepID=A0NNN1_ROSAI|nr:hypothetical protein SIAM614_24122 [Stappia aggregata IAM 12614] [Roseibium aggregatum IAM 12614]